MLADLGVNPNTPLSNVNSASKARKVLEGKPILPPVPMVGEKQFPKHVQEASQEGRAQWFEICSLELLIESR